MTRPRPYTREEAIKYLFDEYKIKYSVSSIRHYAWNGTGPLYHRAGRFVLYSKESLDTLAKYKLGPLANKASEIKRQRAEELKQQKAA